jgi:hypothetical protein
MFNPRWRCFRALVFALSAGLCLVADTAIQAQTSPSAAGQSAQIARVAGTIKSIQGESITLTPDSGSEVKAQVGSTTRILRVAPGQKDLTNATALALQDLQPGDRVLVRGQASADGLSIAALTVIVMKQSDVTAKRERDRQDWQKRGVGGLVDSVDAANGTVTISSGGFGTSKKVIIHTTKDTILRRYAPESVKFDDAKPAPLDQIKAGDQLRARGARSEDGKELTAEEIVSGSFRNIAGTITTIDPATKSITVKDAIAKADVVVKISADSQMKKLPPEMAQRITMRLKAAPGQTGAQPVSADTSRPPGSPNGGQRQRGAGGTGERANGSPDFDRLLGRLPNSSLADLQKSDAVMIVSTTGGGGATVTAITLLAGVESIFGAAPNRNASVTMLSPWSLGGGGAEAEGGP